MINPNQNTSERSYSPNKSKFSALEQSDIPIDEVKQLAKMKIISKRKRKQTDSVLIYVERPESNAGIFRVKDF